MSGAAYLGFIFPVHQVFIRTGGPLLGDHLHGVEVIALDFEIRDSAVALRGLNVGFRFVQVIDYWLNAVFFTISTRAILS